VVCDISGETTLPGLYTIGEVAMTGMHGANRLASNSLLEAVVMARLAATKSYDYFKGVDFPEYVTIDHGLASSLDLPREKILVAHDRRELNRVMSDFVGIVRNEDRLKLALEKVQSIYQAIEKYYFATPATYAVVELRSIATVAELIITSALWRKESRGLHFVEEHPERSTAFERDTIIQGLHAGEVSS
jgi:L-aspartate oxidase